MTDNIVNIFGNKADVVVGFTTTDGQVHEFLGECNYLISDMLEINNEIRLHLIHDGVKLDSIDYIHLQSGTGSH